MVQHVADWVAPFPRSQHSLPPLKLFHTDPSLPPLCARELGAIVIIIVLMVIAPNSHTCQKEGVQGKEEAGDQGKGGLKVIY